MGEPIHGGHRLRRLGEMLEDARRRGDALAVDWLETLMRASATPHDGDPLPAGEGPPGPASDDGEREP